MARTFLLYSEANEFSLVLGGLADAVLLGLMFLAVGSRSVRARRSSACSCSARRSLHVRHKSAGATLRHDWIAYLGLGVCALRRERYALAGALLGLAVMIRAFPVSHSPASALPPSSRSASVGPRAPHSDLVEHLKQHAGAVKVVLVAIATMVLHRRRHRHPVLVRCVGRLAQEISLLDAGIGTNDVSLRALVAFGADEPAYRALQARMPLTSRCLPSTSAPPSPLRATHASTRRR